MSRLLLGNRLLIRLAAFAAALALSISWHAALVAEDISPSDRREHQALTVALLDFGEWETDAPRTFVITPGLGGSRSDDRFWRLASEIKRQIPAANVLLVDWTSAASAKFWGLPAPWTVARRIDSVAAMAAEMLRERDLDPATVTLIGESFGNYLNAAIAEVIGSVPRMLVFNPASELGGYTPPDFRECAERVWSFHTSSPLDTRREISHSGLFLETPPDMNLIGQHTYGVVWLTQQLERRKMAWLSLDLTPPEPKSDAYCGKATLTGELEDIAVPRVATSTLDLAERNPAPQGNELIVRGELP